MPKELEIKKESQIRLDNKAIDNVAQKITEKAGISMDKAKTELGMGIILGMMMNRHRQQETDEKD